MKPLRLRARNLRTYPELDLAFGDGLIGILGELRDAPEGASSNGSGKSTLLEAIDIALFGRRSLAGYLTRGGDVDELMVELTFMHAGDTYRVRRTYSARGRGSTKVDLEQALIWNEDGSAVDTWDPLTCASARETDEKLCAIIGLSRDTFRDSSYLRQGDGGYADPARDPRQRKQLLVEAVLGRDPVWPRLVEVAKLRRKQAEAQLERIAGERESLRELAEQTIPATADARTAHETVGYAATALKAATERFDAATGRYQQAREQGQARQTLTVEAREAETALTALQERERQAETAAASIVTASLARVALATVDAAAATARVDELRAAVVAHEAATREHDSARREQERRSRERADILARADQSDQFARAVEAKAIALRDAERPHCRTCGQAVAGEARENALSEYGWEVVTHAAAAARDRAAAAAIEDVTVPAAPEGEPPTGELRDAETQLRAAQENEKDRARLDERIVQLERAAADRPTADALALAKMEAAAKRQILDALEPVDLALLEQEAKTARIAVETAQVARENAVAAAARADERLAQTKTAADKLADLAATTVLLQADIDRDVLLERAAGRDGIPALIIENTAIPSIEAEASRILHALGTGFQVELRTQAENKSGTLRDTLDVVVIDQDGNEADYADGCSGGEQTRIGLALRIALARLLAHRRGAESRLLALDEPSYLDAAGMSALLEVLRGLESEFDTVLLVSHVAELRDALEDVIVVVKEDGVSSIVGGRVREEVAA